MYTTYHIESWNWYQRVTLSSAHTIEKYNNACKEFADRSEPHVMVLRENVTKIGDYYVYGNGFPAQHNAETDGYVDVRTGKYYKNSQSFCKDLNVSKI
jgi:hypothetical protein